MTADQWIGLLIAAAMCGLALYARRVGAVTRAARARVLSRLYSSDRGDK